MKKFSGEKLDEVELYKPSGEPRGSLRTVLDCLLTDSALLRKLEEKAFTDSGTVVEGEIRLEKGSYALGRNGKKHPVHSIKFSAKCKKEEMDAQLLKGRYRETAVVMASGKSFGSSVQMVFSENNAGKAPMASVRIKKQKQN